MCHTCQIHSKYNIDIILVKKKPKHCNTVEFLEKKTKNTSKMVEYPKTLLFAFTPFFKVLILEVRLETKLCLSSILRYWLYFLIS